MTERLTENTIHHNLTVYGFRLMGAEQLEDRIVPIEELVIDLLKGVDEPRYINGLPVILAKNMGTVKFDQLLDKAKKEGVVNALGWMLEETKAAFERKGIPYKKELANLIVKLEAERKPEEVFLSNDRSESFKNYAKERRNALQKKWNIVDPYNSDEFDRLLKIYRCCEK